MSSHHASLATDQVHGREIDVVVAGNLSMLVLFAYDYILNLEREVELIWHGSFQFTTILYFMVRYLPFFGLVYFLAADSKQSFCTPLLRVMDAMSILARTAVTVVLIAQTYAMYNQSRAILVILGALSLAIVAVDGYEVASDSCDFDTANNMAYRATLSLVILTAFSAAVMGLTLYKVVGIVRQKKSFLQCVRATTLTRLLVVEGICMCGVCLLRLFNILLLVLSSSAFGPDSKPIMLPIAATVVSHFLLNLRDMNGPPESNPTSTKSLAFTTIRLDHDQRTRSIILDASGASVSGDAPILVPGTKQEIQVHQSWQEIYETGSDGSSSGDLSISESWTKSSSEGGHDVV